MSKLDDETIRTPIFLANAVGNLAGWKASGAANQKGEVIAVEIHLNLFILSGNIKGISKPLFTMGNMTPQFIKVIEAFQKQIVGLPKPDGRIDPNGKTLKYLNGPLSARGGKVKPGSLPPLDNAASARQKIAETAIKYLKEGGHFLFGAQGDMPGAANGHPLRPASTMPATFIDRSHPSRLGPSVNAAWRVTHLGTLGCMGCPDKLRNPIHSIIPIEPRMQTVEKYFAFIERAKNFGIPHKNWPGFDLYESMPHAFDAAVTRQALQSICFNKGRKNRFPRRIAPDSNIFLGESCVGRRHYDCIGFVNFVLSRVLKSDWRADITFYQSPSKRFSVTDLSNRKSDVILLAREGDIVLKSADERHCGICVASDAGINVVQCQGMHSGLIKTRLNDEWSFLARLINV
ncbi:hypothetical protein [Hydrogenophaga sp.]|uniref:hypothetical protein n=1 Tax=Hydrogenophaga sp. TaxID=1904254 RepID=UPI002732D6F3|nr:hypothetical protein [Hydrogenophaga sp.]MDP3474702.1 hypothetical protein [Hydrogenophaga sp.]